jgi:transposase
MKVTTIGVDLAKEVFGLHGVDGEGRVALRKRLVRSRLLEFMSKLPPCLVGMEACSSAHYWARKIEQLGHRVRLMSPRFVKPYRKSDKNDANDAEAICEAVTRPSMRFVPIKSEAQHEVLALHRVREQLLKSRTALVNQVRGLLTEHGIVAPQGIARARRLLLEILADPQSHGLSGLFRETLQEMAERLRFLDQRTAAYDDRIERVFKQDERCKRLAKIEGVGPLVATAVVAAVGNASEFKSGRDLSAWLGLVPRQHSSGNHSLLLGISKRGDRYLRTILIHGARAALRRIDHKTDQRSSWAMRIKVTRGHNKAVVALANKNARIIWALLTRGENYRPPAISATAAGTARISLTQVQAS